MDCSACGADNREGARFCRNCGASLMEPAASEATPDAAPVAPELGGEPAPDDADVAPVAEPVTAAEGEPPPPKTPPVGSDPADAADEFLEGGFLSEDELQMLSAGLEAVIAPVEGADAAVEEDALAAEEDVLAAEEDVLAAEEDALAVVAAEDVAVTGEDALAGAEADALAGAEADALEEELEADLPEASEEPIGFWRDDMEPLEALEPQTVVAERFVIVQVLAAAENEIRYRAHDLERCWQCGYEDNAAEDEFCAQCGAVLDHGAEVDLVEVQAGRGVHAGDEPVLARITDAGRHFLVLGQAEPEPEAPGSLIPPSIRLLVGQRSDQGQVRDLDEDSLLSLVVAPTYESRTAPVLGLFAVADGMGGYEGGEVASKLAIQTLADHALRTLLLPEMAGQIMLEDDIVVRLRQATVAANDDVYLTRKKGGTEMGTTMTVALIRDDRLFLSHVGDCRAYRWNADGLEQLTTDHSVVASMIAEGRAQPEEIYTHPHRSVIYRCIGDKPVVDVDTDVLPIVPGDRLILCCDGLWEMVRDEGIEDVMMQEADPQRACDLLVRHANAAGGDDNISVIVVQVEEV